MSTKRQAEVMHRKLGALDGKEGDADSEIDFGTFNA